MISKIVPNIPTVIVLIALAVIVILIVKKMMNDKRMGKSSCGAGCANCAMHGKCHGAENKRSENE